ncbi:hypothetical protein LZC95_28075 [Pendulispora brunnea]|uniref:Uncharacterized protein n=1 Tax=Pendulispora brunnea TaxID=2905690 RepID=A0ABZ2JZG0_9BACT
MGIFDKAKEATSSASMKAAEVKNDVAAKAGELKEQASAKATALKDSATQKGVELLEGAVAKVKDTMRDFNSALPIVRKAGYTLQGVSVTLGLPPQVHADFDAVHPLSDEAVQELLAANAENKLAVVLVKCLSRAQRLQNNIQFAGMAPRGMTVELGLIPTLVIRFGAPLVVDIAPVVTVLPAAVAPAVE